MADLGGVSGRGARRVGLAAMGAAVLVLSQVATGLPSGMTVTASAAPAPSGHPNLVSPSRRVNHLPPPPKPLPGTPQPTSGPLRTAPTVPMAPALVALDPVAGAHFLSSDGVLELTVPAGAVTATDVAAGGGQLNLLFRQVLPASGGNAGGSGHYRFGTWLLQVVDAAGQPAAQGLRQDVAVALHQGQRASALDLSHVYVLVNPPLPSWFDPSPGALTPPPTSPVSGARRAATPLPSPSPTPRSSARTTG